MLLYIGALAALVFAAAATPADARMHHPYRGHRIVLGATAPLDGFTQPAAAYSMRRLRSAYSGPALRLRRASDNAELDIDFLGFTGFTGAPIDTAAANAHCAATSCTVAKWYDQSGNARHVERAFPDQPALTFDCQNGLPCSETNAGQLLLYPSMPVATGKGTIAAVANRKAGAGTCYWMLSNGTNGFHSAGGGPNLWVLEGGSGVIVPAAADNAWHAGIGVLNDASSVVRIDATETTGTVTASAVAGPIYVNFGAASTSCAMGEAVYWDDYPLTASERAALTANQRSFWNF